MPRQHLCPATTLQTDYVIPADGLFHRYGRRQSGLGFGRTSERSQRLVDACNHRSQIRRGYLIPAYIAADDLSYVGFKVDSLSGTRLGFHVVTPSADVGRRTPLARTPF